MNRRTIGGWSLLLAALAAAGFGLGSPAGVGRHAAVSAREPVGVIDGDTLEIGGRVVDIGGIDAPELGQLCRQDSKVWHCGLTAAQSLRKLVDLNQGQITCAPWEGDDSGTKAVCRARHEDLGEVMLRDGYAVATLHAPPSYVDAQREAQDAKLGLWRGRFVEPSRWREGERLPPAPGLPIESCSIKGAISGNGERIYYVPSDAEYSDVALDLATGEAVFCSDDEARAQGWRRPQEATTRPAEVPRPHSGS